MKYFVRAIIMDSDQNKFLVINEKRGQQGVWNFPGGKIEPFESNLSACIRETYEETSLRISDLTLLFEEEYYESEEKWLGYYYLVNRVDGQLNIREEKCNGYTFISLSEILNSDNKYIFSVGSYIERIIYG